jgi:hypothetical protein
MGRRGEGFVVFSMSQRYPCFVHALVRSAGGFMRFSMCWVYFYIPPTCMHSVVLMDLIIFLSSGCPCEFIVVEWRRIHHVRCSHMDPESRHLFVLEEDGDHTPAQGPSRSSSIRSTSTTSRPSTSCQFQLCQGSVIRI